MFKKKEYIERITFNLSTIQIAIEHLNRFSLYDLNIYSEDFFCNLLNMTYNLKLENLNIKDKNMPSIDLADKHNKICYQVTSNNDSSKRIIIKILKYNIIMSSQKKILLISIP